MRVSVGATIADIIKTLDQPEILQALTSACRVNKPNILFDRKTYRWISAINRLMRAARRAILASTSDYNKALEDYEKHSVFTYALLEWLRETDYAAYLMLAMTWKIESPVPMRDLHDMLFPIRTKPWTFYPYYGIT